jgi:hypothetical protein
MSKPKDKLKSKPKPIKLQSEWAMLTVRRLITAYARGEVNAQIDWSDVDSAYEAALEADPQFYLEALAKAHKEGK